MKPEVWWLDAETGKIHWKWVPPTGPWKEGLFRGEYDRAARGQGFCVPNPVGSPTVDANGNFYIGMLDGFIYHLTREDQGQGVKVQSMYDSGACFSSGGVSMAPGMMVI